MFTSVTGGTQRVSPVQDAHRSPSADALAWLRLAAAASGSGRTDEALRIQRQVASAEGTPGPTDPRAYARLLAAAELGRLLADPSAPPEQGESVTRKLKELALFRGPAALCILTWQDYEVPLSLVSFVADKETPSGEPEDAAPVGLAAVLLPIADLARVRFMARFRSDPGAATLASCSTRSCGTERP